MLAVCVFVCVCGSMPGFASASYISLEDFKQFVHYLASDNTVQHHCYYKHPHFHCAEVTVSLRKFAQPVLRFVICDSVPC